MLTPVEILLITGTALGGVGAFTCRENNTCRCHNRDHAAPSVEHLRPRNESGCIRIGPECADGDYADRTHFSLSFTNNPGARLMAAG